MFTLRRIKGISTKILKGDIARGVKTLNETAYTKFYGSTDNSLAFLKTVLRYDIGTVTNVQFKKSDKHWYTCTITTDKGFTIQLKGFSFGFFGEGSRGAVSMLSLLGFNTGQTKKVFTKQSNFRLIKAI